MSQSAAKKQRTLLGFFQKQPRSSSATPLPSSSPPPVPPRLQQASWEKARSDISKKAEGLCLATPQQSSDAIEAKEALLTSSAIAAEVDKENGPILPPTRGDCQANEVANQVFDNVRTLAAGRKMNKVSTYAGSEEESGSEIFKPLSTNAANGRGTKRRKVSLADSDDEYGADVWADSSPPQDMLDDFIAPDESEDDAGPARGKRNARPIERRMTKSQQQNAVPVASDDGADSDSLPTVSTAQQWKFDPDHTPETAPSPASVILRPSLKRQQSSSDVKKKPRASEPEDRYPWLAKFRDIDGNPPTHPDYDPRTIFIPPMAWSNFSPFEKQYWEIKQKLWNTIVFFKKGKFYELYENDATIGHQLFDLKLTDRVNMRMVGVPEASLDHWANQFVGKGYKIARVDQMESALGKEMRERDGGKAAKPSKEDKVIRRELAAIWTSGTLVDGAMLQDDMSTFCVAIKETEKDNLPTFGLAFVDAATAQFHLTEFTDDVDLTRFETFVAQIRPGELLLEKSCISTKALRILKNNTSSQTIWNYIKPVKEFWTAETTIREIDANQYFKSETEERSEDSWPAALREARDSGPVLSAFGALLQYLRTRDLVTLGNFSWYDPIRKATSLVLDGQTLINLEIFNNTFDGSTTGTLFTMLNRCTTPFGKRTLRQWLCHPLVDPAKINARLDAVEALNADSSLTHSFTASLTKLPDLERLISRVHAGRCKAPEFVRVIEGFEQIEYTMSLISSYGSGDGLVGQLMKAMPDLSRVLHQWKNAFDRTKAKDDGILVPEEGVELDFDASQHRIDQVLDELEELLKRTRRELGSTAICYRDNGKEIYQMEIPIKIKNVPSKWQQMSATAKVKRYYSAELRELVRALQEARESHGQILKDVASRFYRRFDEHYTTWLDVVKIVAHLDCLISLARASSSLGQPSCRPVFVADARSKLEFEELRHPCMAASTDDFIPNDIVLGGQAAKVDLLTGANAAGKSTVLRMTCVAVILAQVGCYLPAASAVLTPVDRIMSRLGAHDNIFAAQSTFFVELSETKKILADATPRSLVILDELGRGTSSYDGLAVAHAVLHHVATHVGCLAFFATHYRSLAAEFVDHPEVAEKRMKIDVDEAARQVTFLYKVEDGLADGSFGMHCAAMCGVPAKVVARAEQAARSWEHTGRLKERLKHEKTAAWLPLGLQSDVAALLKMAEDGPEDAPEQEISDNALDVILKMIGNI